MRNSAVSNHPQPSWMGPFSRVARSCSLLKILVGTVIGLVAGVFLVNSLLLSVYSRSLLASPTAILEDTCVPKIRVVFLKTHKCASSTIQNIFMRYGFSRNLLFVLGKNSNYIGHPEPFNHTMVPDPTRFGLEYHILTHHARLNRDEIASVIPKAPIWVTILRDPVAMFESMYSFYSLHRTFGVTLEDMGKAGFRFPSDMWSRRLLGRIGRNQMSFDLGLEINESDSLRVVKEFIREIDSIFDLVMIAERMDESLVLLKDLLCWSVDDVVAFKQNARNITAKMPLKALARKRILRLNAADKMLYDHFLRRFDEKLRDFGETAMRREVTRLRQRRQEWYETCVSETKMGVNAFSDQVIGFLPASEGFANETCHLLLQQELQFTDLIRIRQGFLFLQESSAETKLVSKRHYR